MRKGLLIALVIVVGILAAQESWNVELVGEDILHSIHDLRAVEVSGDYIYVLDDNIGLHVIDVSNPETPVEITTCPLASTGVKIMKYDHYLFIEPASTGLYIVDVNDPCQPEYIGKCCDDYHFKRCTISGSHLYGTTNPNIFRIFDLSDPLEPVELGSLESDELLLELEVCSDFAYVQSNDCAKIFDVSNPTEPEITGTIEDLDTVKEIAISNDIMCILDYGIIRFYNIENPDQPQQISTEEITSFSYHIELIECYLYVTTNEGFSIYSISNPSNPSWKYSYDSPNLFPHGIAVENGYAYLAMPSMGLDIVNVSNANYAYQVGNLDQPGEVYNLAINGDYAYVSDTELGLLIYDISDTENMVMTDCYEEYVFPSAMQIYEDQLYMLLKNWDDQLYALINMDVSDPAHPQEITYYELSIFPGSMTISGDIVYLVGDYTDIIAIDVSDPAQPCEVGNWSEQYSEVGLVSNDNYLYALNWVHGIYIIDINNPSQMETVGQWDVDHYPSFLALENDNLFVADYEDEDFPYGYLYILDVSDPENPYSISEAYVENAEALYGINGNYLSYYDSGGYKIYDIRNANQLNEAGNYPYVGSVYRILMDGQYAYLANSYSFKILDYSAAVGISETDISGQSTALLSNAPNPFNPSTTIRYSLAAPGKVSLCIYNVRGEKVKTLYDGVQDAGAHSHVWDGLDDGGKAVASGVYLSRLESSDQTATGKMLLLK